MLSELDISTEPFSLSEYQAVKTKLVGGKASGPNGIPPEVFKLYNIDEIILHFCNKLSTEEDKPQQWSLIDIIPLPKSCDLGLTTNYRGISLTSTA